MTTKQQVLELLKQNGNLFLSGQEIAEKIFVSRAAVWKAIKSLEKEGYVIDAVTNKGYRLKQKLESMNADNLQAELLAHGLHNFELFYYDNVESTNESAKSYSSTNYGKPALFVADSQSKGKGRRGRDFFSPSGTGLYMSLLVYPDTTPEQATLFTCMMADCVCEAIKEVTGIETQIKWVNDIYYNDRKIAGILTEGMTSMEDGKLSFLVIGVGINLFMPYEGFPTEISKTAGYLLDTMDADIRGKLCAYIVKKFMDYYNNPDDLSYISGYKNKSMLIGKYVKLLTPTHEEKKSSKGYALVTGIDDNCHLQIEYEDGAKASLSYGEVSVVKY